MARFVAERPVRILEGLFRPCGELGSPVGVQEDYDIHWQVDDPAPSDAAGLTPAAGDAWLWDEDRTFVATERLEMERVTPHLRWRPAGSERRSGAERQVT